jgi:single-stranded DNA-binding protein
MINEIKIEGRICGKNKPELKQFESGDHYTRFSIQWKGSRNGRNLQSYFSIVMYGKLALDFCGQNIWDKKPDVQILGMITSRVWEGKNYFDIICNQIKIIGYTPAPAKQAAPAKPPAQPKQATTPAQEEEVLDF